MKRTTKNGNNKSLSRTTSPGMRKSGKNKTGPKRKFSKEQLRQIEFLAKHGLTNKELAEFFQVSVSSIEYWWRKYEPFREAKRRGQEVFDEMVEDSVAMSAKGFEREKTEIRQTPKGTTVTTTTEYYPPNPTMAIFWLTNRQPEKWKHMQKMYHEHKADVTHHFDAKDIPVDQLTKEEQELLFNINVKSLGDGRNQN